MYIENTATSTYVYRQPCRPAILGQVKFVPSSRNVIIINGGNG